MILPGAVLLPKTIMPLRIFEEKYRQMLETALSGTRMFVIAHQSDAPQATKQHDVATVGLIRMSSQNPDGSSLLMLEGTERVRIEKIRHEDSYPVVDISPIPTTNRPNEVFEAEIVVDLLEKIDRIDYLVSPDDNDAASACHAIDDLEMLAHFAIQTYCDYPDSLQRVLEATDLVERCKTVSDILQLQIMLKLDEEG